MSVEAEPQIPTTTRLEEIQQRIAWHYGQIAILKAEANSHSPVFTLPTEIVSKILTSYAFGTGPFDSGWMRAMFVCRRWYDIVLSEQQLWGNIDISSPTKLRSLEIILARSGLALLHVKITSLSVDISPSPLVRHSERLRQLDLSGAPQSVAYFANTLPSYEFLVLQALRLALNYDHGVVPDPSLLDAMFDGRAPRLTSLDLQYVDASWDLIRGVTMLSLTPNMGSGSKSEPIISLPLLQSLSIMDSSGRCHKLLRHIMIPPNTRLSVDGWDFNHIDNINQLLGPISQHLRAASAPPIRCVRLGSTSTPEKPHLFRLAFSEHDGSSEEDSLFTITTYPPSGRRLRDFMTMILGILSDVHITHLDCRDAPQATPLPAWKDALALLPALEVIYMFADSTAVRFLTVLAQLAGKKVPKDGYPTHLRHIHVSATACDGGSATVRLVFEALQALLSALHGRGTPLAILEIRDLDARLDVDEESWNLLSQLAGTLIRNNM
ncbi:hypothetical protein B0H14DRAFT_3869551 [Mycena olivaceomarginata]|nr:hypothetical protein B0H14DRAFT_3869551 [Mycena olivaceomarginata]